MIIIHNGEETEVEEGITLQKFLRQTGYRRVMVKVNGVQITASQFSSTELKEGDEILAKRISGGG